MRRIVPAVVLSGLVLASSALSAEEGSWFSRWKQGFHRNNSWPQPFLQPDRDAVMVTIEAMERNGWRKQTMVCDYHFEPDTTKLTAAGELKIRWIMTQVPLSRRIIFVQRATTPEDTSGRIEAVQRLAARSVRTGQLPEVVETDIETTGWPADTVDAITKKRAESQPDPVLPARVEANGGM